MAVSDEQLYQLLSGLDYIPPARLDEAKRQAAVDGVSLYYWVLKHDLLSDENLGRLVANSLQLPFVVLDQLKISQEILKIAPQTVAVRHYTIVFDKDDKVLKIATSNPQTTDLFEMLAKKAGVASYRLYYATDRDVEQAFGFYKKDLTSALHELMPHAKAADVPVAELVTTIIESAYTDRASDIHIEPSRTASLVRFRVDGVLHDKLTLPHELHDRIVAWIKVLSHLRTDEHFSAQDGSLSINLTAEPVDMRVSVVPLVTGAKVVMRLLTSRFRQFGLTDLGMSQSDLNKVQKGFNRAYGMVLSTGPTGSGKTTTMYAVLKILNVREKNIATIEDPVEYRIEGINQIQANPKTNLTFANGLSSILRQDPDVIFVGEIRDDETAGIAINSAMTGHLVISTLHTNDAATTLPRLIDMHVEPFLVASTVNTIIAQRLVRKICPVCKVSVKIVDQRGDADMLKQLSALDSNLAAKFFGGGGNVRLYRGKGCATCNQTGYLGRTGIFEVLEVSPAIQTLIAQKANISQIKSQAVSEGMTPMEEDGLAKVTQGITSIEEVLRVTRE